MFEIAFKILYLIANSVHVFIYFGQSVQTKFKLGAIGVHVNYLNILNKNWSSASLTRVERVPYK